MGLIDPSGGKAGSLVAAAMESAGIAIQAEMLKWMQGDGQMVAGGLYMLAIVAGVFTFAAGGQYIWARYLLVGPALFFFLTQVTAPSTGSHWEFADHKFSDEHRDRALRNTGHVLPQGEVSLFFQTWNTFMSSVTQELMELLHLTQDQSHLNFMSKMERYMHIWVSKKITDDNLGKFVRLIMINQCADYYMMLMALSDPHIDEVEKTYYREQIAKRTNVIAFVMQPNPDGENEMHSWLRDHAGMTPGSQYTCQQLWEKAVNALKPSTEGDIAKALSQDLGVDQTEAATRETWLKKMQTRTDRFTEQVELTQEAQADQANAVLWVIARSLWNEMSTSNKYTEYFNQEGHSAYFASDARRYGFNPDRAGTNTSSAFQQHNTTEQYQFKGDFVNAALSLPYFQGLALLLLSASFPFFAMVVVLPGRAGSILMWMGLWAWIKLWDFGFAVVMMIDNILYTVFPRGPAITPGDINNPGKVLVKLMEIDPTYSATVYYNIIAICMYAVPIATGVFVKGAGSGFIGSVHGAWKGHSTRLAGSAVSFARALQGQSYVANQRRTEAAVVANSLNEILGSEAMQKEFQAYLAASAGETVAGEFKDIHAAYMKKYGGGDGSGPALSPAATKAFKEYMAMQKNKHMNTILSNMTAYAQLKEYQHSSGPAGWWASESAVVAKYYSHDTTTPYPGQAMFSAELARNVGEGQENIYGGGVDSGVNFGFDVMEHFAFPAGGPKK